jgi:diguanylate cyclase (GGDEF)-like protein
VWLVWRVWLVWLVWRESGPGTLAPGGVRMPQTAAVACGSIQAAAAPTPLPPCPSVEVTMIPRDAADWLAQARACLARGELVAGTAAAARATDLAQDPAQQAEAGWLQAQLTFRRRDYAGVLALAQRLTPLLRSHPGDELREFLRAVALAGSEINRFDAALPAAYEALRLAEASGSAGPRALALNALGVCFERIGDPWRAEPLLREALAIAREGGSTRELYLSLNNLCAVLISAYFLQRGAKVSADSLAAMERALPLAEEAVQLAQALSEPHSRTVADGNLGEILVHLGERERAQAILQRAHSEAARHGFAPERQRLTCALAEWELRHGSPQAVRALLQPLLAELRPVPEPISLARANHALYQAFKALGDPESALQHLERHAEIKRQGILQQMRAQSELFTTRIEAEQARREAERQRARVRSLEADTRRDPLTGLANRRAADEGLAALLPASAASGRPLALAMLDLDHFKQVNDRYGHPVGDHVLVAAAQLLREGVRGGDLVARVGGEEFLALLPDADAAQAREVCERIGARFAAHDWGALAPGLTLTLSAGLACSPPHDAQALLARADAALYRAKNAGRSRIEIG